MGRQLVAWTERRPDGWWAGASCTCGYTVDERVGSEDPAVVEDVMMDCHEAVGAHQMEAPECVSLTRRAWGERPTGLGAALGALDALEEDILRDRLFDSAPDVWGRL